MTITQTKCDVCGALKGETNHWWKLTTEVEVYDREKECRERDVTVAIHLYPADRLSANRREALSVSDLCGERCVISKVSELMGAAK